MKIFFALLLAMLALSVLGEQEHFSIESVLKEGEGEIEGKHFPDNFSFNCTTRMPSGYTANSMYKVNYDFNVFSISSNYFNSTFGRNVTDTVAWDFSKKIQYTHSTGNNACRRASFSLNNVNVAQLVDWVWDN